MLRPKALAHAIRETLGKHDAIVAAEDGKPT